MPPAFLRRIDSCVFPVVLAIALLGSQLRAHTVRFATNGDADITIESWFEHVPAVGFMPMTIKVTNRTDKTLSWNLESQDRDYQRGTMKSSFEFGVAPGGTSNTDILVPLMPPGNTSAYSYSNIELSISGPAISGGRSTSYLSSSSARTRVTGSVAKQAPSVAISQGMSGGDFEKNLKGMTSPTWTGDVVNVLNAPTDWRGYSALALLFLDDVEWTRLNNAQRLAMFSWVAAGGRLVISSTSGMKAIPMPEGFAPWMGERLNHGLGSVQMVASGDLGKPLISDLVTKASASSVEKIADEQPVTEQTLSGLVPKLVIHSGLIFLFILIFGTIVGPINLFVFARGHHRPRLFWTTPLISLIGTVVLGAVMVLQDGFGGTGARVSLAVVVPEQKEMVVIQEQLSKTGILLGRTFELPKSERTVLMPSPTFRETRTRYGSSSFETDKRDYLLTSSIAGGGFFTSRAMQRQFLHSVRSNRGGIEITGGESPAIVSSLGVTLKHLYLRDANQRLWKAEQVRTGEKTPLKLASDTEFRSWQVTEVLKNMGKLMRDRIDSRSWSEPGWFFADVAEPSKLAVPTLTTISWNSDRAFVTGRLITK